VPADTLLVDQLSCVPPPPPEGAEGHGRRCPERTQGHWLPSQQLRRHTVHHVVDDDGRRMHCSGETWCMGGEAGRSGEGGDG
jgi:hypothetical protein